MTVVIIAALLVVVVIALAIWFMLGRDAFGPDTGTKDDNQNWSPPGV